MHWTKFKSRVKLNRNLKKKLSENRSYTHSLNPYSVVIFADTRYVLSSYHSLFPLKIDD